MQKQGAYQLRGNHAADQLLSFSMIESTIPLHPKLQASRLQLWLYIPVCGNSEGMFSHIAVQLSPTGDYLQSKTVSFSDPRL